MNREGLKRLISETSSALFLNSKRIKKKSRVRLALYGAGMFVALLLVLSIFSSPKEDPPPPPPRAYPVEKLTITFGDTKQKKGSPAISAVAGSTSTGTGDPASQSRLDPKAVSYFERILKEKKIPPKDIDDTLADMTRTYTALNLRLSKSQSPHSDIDRLSMKAGTALSEMDFAKAEKTLFLALEKQSKNLQTSLDALTRQELGLARIYADIGDLRYAQIDYKRAKEQYQKATEVVPKKTQAPLAEYMKKWGLAAYALGNLNEAEKTLRRSMEIREELYGKKYEKVSDIIGVLARTYQAMGRYSDAERLFARIIEEDAGGGDRAAVAATMSRLAHVIQAQGRLEEAEALSREVLVIDENTIGTDHMDHARHLNILAAIVHAQGKPEEAETLYRKARTIYEKTLGVQHPETSIILNNLAGVVGAQGRFEDAEKLFLKAISIDEKTVGKYHPQHIKHLNNLAALLQAQGRKKEAEDLYRKALNTSNATLGSDHPQSITIAKNLKILLDSRKK